MIDILLNAEQLMDQKRNEFLGDSDGRLREVLERIWVDKFKWGKTITCCKLGMYDDLKVELEERGFFVFSEMRYGEVMLCISLK
jgi:hypothetical protein